MESAQEVRDRSAAAAAEQQALLAALGPPPGDGEPAEDAIAATERSRIVAQLSHDLGRVARCNVVLARARDLLERTVREDTAALFSAIEERTVSPLMPGVVVAAFSQLRDRLAELTTMAGHAWRSSDLFRPWSRGGASALAVVALTLLVALPLRRWLLVSRGPPRHSQASGAPRAVPEFRRQLARFRVAILSARDRRTASRQQRDALRDPKSLRRGRNPDPLPPTRRPHSWRRTTTGSRSPGRNRLNAIPPPPAGAAIAPRSPPC